MGEPVETTKLLGLPETLVNKIPGEVIRHLDSKFVPRTFTIAVDLPLSLGEVLEIERRSIMERGIADYRDTAHLSTFPFLVSAA